MKWETISKWMNIAIPVIGIGLLIFYEVCDTSCSSLRGTFLGIDLKIVGILFTVVLLAMLPLGKTRFSAPVDHLRTMMLAGAVGGEILLVRFQIVLPLLPGLWPLRPRPLRRELSADEQISGTGSICGRDRFLLAVF